MTDADLFFGREELTASLIDRLTSGLELDQRSQIVIGASGSDKSSETCQVSDDWPDSLGLLSLTSGE